MTTLAVLVGLFIMGAISFLMTIYMMLQMVLLDIGQAHPSIQDNSILYIDLDTEIVEREHGATLSDQLMGRTTDNIALGNLLDALRYAADDPKIKGVYLDCGGVSAGVTTLLTINRALADFRKSGKWVAAYADDYTQGDYLLASAADSLWLNPVGAVDIHGVGSGMLYFKGLVEKLGVNVQVLKVGTYKSAVEPFMLTGPSDANIEQMREYLNPIWADACKAIADGRGVAPADVNAWADSIVMAQDPATYPARKIVTALRYRHDAEEALKAMSGLDPDDDDDDDGLRLVSAASYVSSAYPHKQQKKQAKADYRIAVVYAEGDIVQEGDEGIVGADMAPLIYDLADDDDTNALVLRVNSGGGSAYASEQIWEALEYFKGKGKPFYASMGDVAASGGYYISCGADSIFCEPTTLTGSIGIFGIIPEFGGAMEKHLGINYHLIATNPNALIGTMQPMTAVQRNAMQGMIERGYETFVARCASGRATTADSIKAVAEGRVWVGTKALEIGLVDQLGSLADCIQALADNNGVDKYAIDEYPDPAKPWWEKLIEENMQMRQAAVKRELGAAYPFYKAIKDLEKMDPIQARANIAIDHLK